MPGVDWIPGVAHIKSVCQLVSGDVEGFKRTNENFIKECPVVSQVTSTVQYISGDTDGALETQKRCLETINNVANATPVVGHVKGAIHHAVGDHEGGNQALNAATRTTTVVGAGVAVGFATGGVGAVPAMLAASAGIGAGVVYDTGHSFATHETQGSIAALENAIDHPSAGTIFDALAVPAFDGLAGYSGGKVGGKINKSLVAKKRAETTALNTRQHAAKINKLKAAQNAKLVELENLQRSGGPDGQALKIGQEINSITAEISKIRTGYSQFWIDPKNNEIVTSKTPNSVIIVGKYDCYIEKSALREIYAMQEKYLNHDFYYNQENTGKRLSRDQRVASIRQKHTTLKDNYKNLVDITPFLLTIQKFMEGRKPNDPNWNQQQREEFERALWLLVQLPFEFSYTTAIMANSINQGLLHSFIRHSDQWSRFIPDLSQNRYIYYLQNEYWRNCAYHIQNDNFDRTKIREFQQSFSYKFQWCENYELSRLIDAQSQIHQFIQRNVTYGQYLGEGANTNGQEQLYFKVRNLQGQEEIMVLALSSETYNHIPGLFDPRKRPIRSIITVFFMPISDKHRILTQLSKK